jgi:hypothetical protein
LAPTTHILLSFFKKNKAGALLCYVVQYKRGWNAVWYVVAITKQREKLKTGRGQKEEKNIR